MESAAFNLLVILGPTASGKTGLGVTLAAELGGEILSVDSRQVYRGLDIGSGKDLDSYSIEGRAIPYHLIDIVDLDTEYNSFMYQRDFYAVIEELRARATLPVAVGGTGLYLDTALRRFRMVETPQNESLRHELEGESDAELARRLRSLKPTLHNTTDLTERARMIRAIEIELYQSDNPPLPAPDLRPLLLGARWERSELRERIRRRLKERFDEGLIEEVEQLLDRGVSQERLHRLGLEYRYVADFLGGTIKSRNDLSQKLASAICQYAKRQATWFRRMERNGSQIHWIDRADPELAMAVYRDECSSRA